LDSLHNQLQAVLDGAPTNAAKIATQTGAKDKFYQYFHEKLSEICRAQKNSDAIGGLDKMDTIKRIIAEARATMPEGDTIFNPALLIDGKRDVSA
jgi:hypothetical protein